MTGREYRALLLAMISDGHFENLGHAAEWFGITRQGERLRARKGPPIDAAKLLQLMAAMKLTARKVDDRIAAWRKKEAARYSCHVPQEPLKKPERRAE